MLIGEYQHNIDAKGRVIVPARFREDLGERFYVTKAAEVEPDKQGRILLPQHLREYAGLEKDVAFIGTSNRAEIWDAQRWASFNAELDDSSLIAVMEELQFYV